MGDSIYYDLPHVRCVDGLSKPDLYIPWYISVTYLKLKVWYLEKSAFSSPGKLFLMAAFMCSLEKFALYWISFTFPSLFSSSHVFPRGVFSNFLVIQTKISDFFLPVGSGPGSLSSSLLLPSLIVLTNFGHHELIRSTSTTCSGRCCIR